jgi:cell division protein FtsB
LKDYGKVSPENNFTRFASGVIFSSFIVLFTFDGVAILKYTTVVYTSLLTMVSRSQLNKENFTIEISLSIKTAISEAPVGLHKKIETQEKEISDLKSESNQIKIENRRLNDNVFDLMVDIEELEQYGRRNSLRQ